jgi:hypothetical protein
MLFSLLSFFGTGPGTLIEGRSFQFLEKSRSGENQENRDLLRPETPFSVLNPLAALFASEQPQTIYNIFNGLGSILAMADSVLYRLLNKEYGFL